MNDSTNLTRLRWTGLDLKNALYGQNPYVSWFMSERKLIYFLGWCILDEE